MLTAFAAASGYLPSASCDLAARLHAAAAQIHSLYLQAQWVLDQSFPQTAQGIYLERHAAMRGLFRSVASRSAGYLRFGISTAARDDLLIPAGTVCMTAGGIRFETAEEALLPVGALYVDVPAIAAEPGSSGNVAPGTVTIMSAMPVGIRQCTNPDFFTGGTDAEDDDTLRQRLLDTYQRLPNGANAAYYEQIALSWPGVAAAKAVGRPRGIGSVDLYLATEEGLPGGELLSEIHSFLQAQREISVDLQVKAPTPAKVNITAFIQPAEGYEYTDALAEAETALQRFFTGELLGQGVTLARLGNILYQLKSISNYRITSPSSDLAAEDTVLPVPGEFLIMEWEDE